MKNLHALVLACLAPCLALSVLADAPSPLSPISREGTKNWKDRYDQQVEQLRNNPCGVLFLGDSITDYWDRGGKQAWDKMFKPYHPCNFGISGDQTTNLIYRITHSGMPAQTDPKLCIVMIGTNNTGHFKGGEDPEKNGHRHPGGGAAPAGALPGHARTASGNFPPRQRPARQAAPAQ
ncbi:hypothetical protein J5W64_02060 [Candidatus Akkermansia timonensis]|nr:GDSL-type esterase/lipase family protein [Candidatus Akkermansia timonensis]QWO91216.1 hypothetical protein J5W64_02060 [Candidatus Akkermansia timonensis]